MSSLNCISKKVAEAPKIDFGDLFNESRNIQLETCILNFTLFVMPLIVKSALTT